MRRSKSTSGRNGRNAMHHSHLFLLMSWIVDDRFGRSPPSSKKRRMVPSGSRSRSCRDKSALSDPLIFGSANLDRICSTASKYMFCSTYVWMYGGGGEAPMVSIYLSMNSTTSHTPSLQYIPLGTASPSALPCACCSAPSSPPSSGTGTLWTPIRTGS